MLNRTGTALAAILLAAGLSACGGSSEFKTKALEMCQKSPDAATQDCACAVEIMDKELDDKTTKIFLIVADPELQKDEAKAKAALEAAGYKEEDLMAIVPAIMPIMEKVQKECTKKPS